MISVTVLVDDHLEAPLLAEHGLSLLLEAKVPGHSATRLLLDTGQRPRTLAHNAKRLKVNLKSLDLAVLSHGHYDHTGGLPALLAAGYKGPLYAGPAVGRSRYSAALDAGTLKEIGMPESSQNAALGLRSTLVNGTLSPANGVTLFTLDTPAPDNPRLRNVNRGPDDFSDELFALLDDGQMATLASGCTHHRLTDAIERANKLLPEGRHVNNFVGGLHTMGLPRDQVELLARQAAGLGVAGWQLLHCSGEEQCLWWHQAIANSNNQ